MKRGCNYADLIHSTMVMNAVLMTEAIGVFFAGRLDSLRYKQAEGGPAHSYAPPEVMEDVHRKLAEQTYKCYDD